MAWLQIRLAINPQQASGWEERLLALGALSVTFMDAEDQPIYEPELGTTPLWSNTHLLALFEDDLAAKFVLQELASEPNLPPYEVETIAEQDWERSWMDDFKPMRFGQRLWVVPSWHQAPEPDAVNILLDPGLAFGTGTHPTTSLCLEWLDGQQLNGCEVLDFGCGSGILAIAALLLGAQQATGTDIDPQALQASAENAKRNGINEGNLQLLLAAEMPKNIQFDVVLANILAAPLIELAPLLTKYTRPGGHIALSGILQEQAEQVRSAYADNFTLQPIVTQDGWVCITGTRKLSAT